jgi:hypothetical protein
MLGWVSIRQPPPGSCMIANARMVSRITATKMMSSIRIFRALGG